MMDGILVNNHKGLEMKTETITVTSRQLRPYVFLINQIFEIENKVNKLAEKNTIERNVKKLKSYFEEEAFLFYDNPVGENYSETRTDVEANISGDEIDDLVIVDVVKPIIRIKQGKTNQIVQKGIVIVESEKGKSNE